MMKKFLYLETALVSALIALFLSSAAMSNNCKRVMTQVTMQTSSLSYGISLGEISPEP